MNDFCLLKQASRCLERRSLRFFLPIILVSTLVGAFSCSPQEAATSERKESPNDYFWAQRAFPHQTVPAQAYYDALDWTDRRAHARGVTTLDWSSAGPFNVGGRITDLAMHPTDLQTMYAATATGGVWKSDDAGQNWYPVSDALPSLSIGDIALDPSDKNTVYCGTGETNGGGGSTTYDGRGIFKSPDGGATWQPLGLEACGSIGRIIVDPRQPSRIFVAAMGQLYGNNPERGLYRSTDGGQSWEKKLFVNDSVGVVDMAIDPLHPDTVFAVSWERIRRPNKRVYGGPGSALWRSTDGGEHWVKLADGLPGGNAIGRMGIDISASDPAVLYVTVSRTNGSFAGVYRSSNHGETFSPTPQSADPGYFSYGWWFGQIRVHPADPDQVFNLGADWLKSSNGGMSWSAVSDYLHVDYHALYIHPANPDLRLAGNDGGVYLSIDGGVTWQHRPFPITQFYTGEINFQYPTLFSGGTQDNGTQASTTGGLYDWVSIQGGDGFTTLVNPVDSSLYYTTSTYGILKGSNGASAPVSARYNWNAPLIFDPVDPDILYFGAEKVYKSIDQGLHWAAISDDLSNGPSGAGGVVYGTITSIAASPLDSQVLLAGTDDGNVWVTADGGNHWEKVSANLPKRWVTRVVADRWDSNTAYVCFSGFRHNESMAHLYKTTDLGQTWVSVAGDLPDIPVNDLVLDPLYAGVMYIGTDAGVFFSSDSGGTWQWEWNELPRTPVTDLTFHGPTRTLLAATFGRGMYRCTAPFLSGAQQPEVFSQVRVAPNPFRSTCHISMAAASHVPVRLELYDASGRWVTTVDKGALQAGRQTIDLQVPDLRAGVYYLQLIVQGSPPVVRKIVKMP